MGSGMGRSLLKAGFPLAVYNRSADKAAPLVAEGARLADSPRAAAAGAQVVISMVADDNASRDVWLGERGALGAAAAGTVLIESSTLSPEWISSLAAAAAQRSCELLDAPVTGSKTHAANGELKFLVGGSAATLENARPVLAAMGRAIVHVGPTGSGALLKLINNFLCGVQAASLAEAVALIEHAGLDTATALDVLTNGAPGSPLVKTMLPRMSNREYTPNFPLALMVKDLEYATAAAAKHGVHLASVLTALDAYKRAVDDGHGAQDFAAVVEPLREKKTTR
jgi:3-hydroxyisobutyrate dehydrogenase